jgi:hypothetical protein
VIQPTTEPNRCPGGIVAIAFDTMTEEVLDERLLDVEADLFRAAAESVQHVDQLDGSHRYVSLVFYDGDSGECLGTAALTNVEPCNHRGHGSTRRMRTTADGQDCYWERRCNNCSMPVDAEDL